MMTHNELMRRRRQIQRRIREVLAQRRVDVPISTRPHHPGTEPPEPGDA